MIKREFAEKWIYKLKKYWLEKNIDGVCSLFTNTKFYQETPFIKPFLTIEEIKEEWYHVKNEEIHNIEINTINYHIKKIYNDNELKEESTIRKFRTVQKKEK